MPLLVHATANRPGAIAILQLLGDSAHILEQLTGETSWPVRRLRLVDLGGIDEGLVVQLTDEVTQVMPHGGPRVVQKLMARFVELGATLVQPQEVDALSLFPEAADRCEAVMLQALAAAESPLAIDLLLDQPRRWRENQQQLSDDDMQRSKRLNRLIHPPMVVLAGRPNVGKSTLSNALLGRSMSIALDVPGTTRDYTAGRINLGGLVVDWHDTPGIRSTDDPIEAKAIGIASRLLERADLIIAMRDPKIDWPVLPRPADVFLMNKSDLLNDAELQSQQIAIAISAHRGDSIPALVNAVRESLVSTNDLEHPGPWLFDERLLSIANPR